ncbi:hypothetical protein J2848_004175 [Azospirillum lipoferum]|uniref:Uncharacterized protein n=1 Tax=Azospirillum lipoferum TaxID=193 RepID=A0A5A9GJD2_AZOLI|nr:MULTISPECIES: hypothetical protein [Azospirillum]KAA0594005.1 hypothetical protein FZ942_21455 [Azospirillum lipoferum]MCP1612484.1 hypothetical protein [Azospirillum lipoferum]MDW5531733.1 hypothetical protein [Azospirillum sp. NL1]
MEMRDLVALGDKLLDIDEAKFRQVVTLLEQMNDHPDIQRTIAVIRPRLVELRLHRRPTLKRLFCDPFEDLFEALGKADPVPLSVIERSLMNGLWPLVEAQVGKERLRAYRPALHDGPERKALTDAFWADCAAAVAKIAEGAVAGHFSEALDLRMNPSRTRALADIATILSIAPEVAELKAALSPKPVPKLHGDHVEAIQSIGRRISRANPEALKIFVLLAASRLTDPSVLLSGLWDMDLGQKSADRATLFMQLSGTVVAQIEDRSRLWQDTQASDRMAVADLALDLVASLDATRTAMEHSRNKEFDQRLKQVRNSVHAMVKNQVLQDADAGIVAAVGALDNGAIGSSEGRAQLAQAENHARALRKCATIADSLGLRGELREVTQKTTASLTEKAQQALGGPAGNARTGYTAIRMIELIAGPAEANKIMDGIMNGGRR